MKIFEKIQSILDKGLINMTLNEQRELNICRDQLHQYIADTSNDLNIAKQELKEYEGKRTLQISEEKTEDGKKLYTVGQVESIIMQETKDMKTNINTLVYTINQLEGKLDSVANYVTNIRDYLKTIPQEG